MPPAKGDSSGDFNCSRAGIQHQCTARVLCVRRNFADGLPFLRQRVNASLAELLPSKTGDDQPLWGTDSLTVLTVLTLNSIFGRGLNRHDPPQL